jgi:hypothetical protein
VADLKIIGQAAPRSYAINTLSLSNVWANQIGARRCMDSGLLKCDVLVDFSLPKLEEM